MKIHPLTLERDLVRVSTRKFWGGFSLFIIKGRELDLPFDNGKKWHSNMAIPIKGVLVTKFFKIQLAPH